MTTLGMEPLFILDDKDNEVFTILLSASGFGSVISRIDEVSENTKEKSNLFEKVTQAFVRQGKTRSEQLSHIWRWSEWPGRNNWPDTGIDLVARERDFGLADFSEGIIVSTTENWGQNVENALKNRDKPVARLGLWHF